MSAVRHSYQKVNLRQRARWSAVLPQNFPRQGKRFHSQTNTTWFIHTPGLIVVAPSSPYDAKGLLTTAIRDDNPVLFFEHKKLCRSIKEEVPSDDYTIPLMKAEIKRRGRDITLISYGYTLHLALQAAEKMRQERGTEVEVIDLRTLSPMDSDTFLESVSKTNRVVVVYEDNRTLGIGAEISAIIAEEAFDCLDVPIVRVAPPDIPAIPAADHRRELRNQTYRRA